MQLNMSSTKPVVTAIVAALWLSGPASAQEPLVEDLLRQLREAEPGRSDRLVQAIRNEWAKSGSATIDLLFRRGQEAMEAGDFELAIEHFTAALDHDSGFAAAYNGRANALYRLDYLGPALADLQRALALNPHNFIALRGMAVILEEADRPDEAIAAYRAVLGLHPNDENALQAIERIEATQIGEAI